MDLDNLLERFRGPLVAMLASWGASPRDAVELAQDVFSEAYLSRERFVGDWSDVATAGGWLRGIARNLFRAQLRKSRREVGPVDRDAEVEWRPEEAESKGVLQAIGRLRRSWRIVLTMHYLEGSSLAEIGALLGVSERSVEGRLRRARAELRELLVSESVATDSESESGDEA